MMKEMKMIKNDVNDEVNVNDLIRKKIRKKRYKLYKFLRIQ